jgi:hypothetical protein
VLNISDIYLERQPFIDLTPFFEDKTILPLINGQVVKHKSSTYRVEHYHWHPQNEKGYFTKHCYIFVDITIGILNHKLPFAKKPSTIEEMIKSKKITIISNPRT